MSARPDGFTILASLIAGEKLPVSEAVKDELQVAYSDLNDKFAASLKLSMLQHETLQMYRELVELRKRQIIALGGDPT